MQIWIFLDCFQFVLIFCCCFMAFPFPFLAFSASEASQESLPGPQRDREASPLAMKRLKMRKERHFPFPYRRGNSSNAMKYGWRAQRSLIWIDSPDNKWYNMTERMISFDTLKNVPCHVVRVYNIWLWSTSWMLNVPYGELYELDGKMKDHGKILDSKSKSSCR